MDLDLISLCLVLYIKGELINDLFQVNLDGLTDFVAEITELFGDLKP